MGGVDDVVVAQQGVCAVEFRDDVFRGDFAGGVGDGEGRLGGERDGFEITFRGGGFQGRVRSGAGRGEETLEGGVGDPALDGDAAFVFVGADEIEAFGAPAATEDGERIAGRSGFVNDEARGGAFGGGDFVFVGPATVVGHRVALEDGGIEFAGGGIDAEGGDGVGALVGAEEPSAVGTERKVVGQKGQAFAILVFGNNSANHLRIVFGGVVNSEHACLIANDLSVRTIDWLGVSPLKRCVGLGSRDKERLRLVNGIKSFVVEVAAIHDIERSRLGNDLVENIDIVQ